MDITRKQFTNSASGKELGKGPMNTFSNVPEYPPANFKVKKMNCLDGFNVRAGGKSLRRVGPFFLKKTGQFKAAYRRRRLTENGLSSFDLESRFYEVLSKDAQVA